MLVLLGYSNTDNAAKKSSKSNGWENPNKTKFVPKMLLRRVIFMPSIISFDIQVIFPSVTPIFKQLIY